MVCCSLLTGTVTSNPALSFLAPNRLAYPGAVFDVGVWCVRPCMQWHLCGNWGSAGADACLKWTTVSPAGAAANITKCGQHICGAATNCTQCVYVLAAASAAQCVLLAALRSAIFWLTHTGGHMLFKLDRQLRWLMSHAVFMSQCCLLGWQFWHTIRLTCGTTVVREYWVRPSGAAPCGNLVLSEGLHAG